MSCLDYLSDRLKNCRTKVVILLSNLLIASVNYQNILCQIVGSDTEEICFLRELFCKHNTCRGLDHHTRLDILVVFLASLVQLLLTFLYNFIHRNDHREHNPYMTECTCTENCTELLLKHVFHIQRNTDCPPSKERILLFLEFIIRQFFISADIQCTDCQFL